MINYILLVSRQGLLLIVLSGAPCVSLRLGSPVGKVRLAKWFTTMQPKAKAKIVKDVTQLVLARRTRMCNFLEYKGASVAGGPCVIVLTVCRHEGRVSPICLAVLRVRYRANG